jgi:transcriptional regulator with XRE-family HTH domain
MPAPQEPAGAEDAEPERGCRSREAHGRPEHREGTTGLPNYYRRQQRRLNVDGVAFGARVQELRLARGWSLENLRDASGVPLMTLSNLENGKTTAPHPALTMALAETFGFATSFGLLAGREPEIGPGQGPAAPPPPPGFGATTLEDLVKSLLRGVWGAQDARAAADGAARERPSGVISLAVGVVVLADGTSLEARQAPDPDPPGPAGA